MPPVKEMTREQMILLASRGYLPSEWEILYDLPHTMIIRTKDRKDAAIIFKDGPEDPRQGSGQ